MKMTMLEMVQDILSDMDSDEVNSITDTIEAQQVAKIIRTTYNEIVDSRHWPHFMQLTQLDGMSDLDRPTHMSIPENISYIKWIKYNKKDSANDDEKMVKIKYLEPEDFLNVLHARKSTSTDVQVVYDDDVDVGPLLIQTNKHPDYWTTFDDETVVFDSIDNSVAGQATLLDERSLIHCYLPTELTIADASVPDLPSKVFSYLLAEAKSVCFISIAQSPNEKEEQKSRRQRTWLAREKRRQNKGVRYPDYGRKSVRHVNSNNTQTDSIAVSDPDYIP